MKRDNANEFKVIGILLGLIATFMIVFPALKFNDLNASFTGLQVVFGYEILDFGWFGTLELKFSFLNLVAYLLPAAAALTLILMKSSKLISTILFAVATILLFLVKEFTVVGSSNPGSINWQYGIGLIIAIILSALGFAIGMFRILKSV